MAATVYFHGSNQKMIDLIVNMRDSRLQGFCRVSKAMRCCYGTLLPRPFRFPAISQFRLPFPELGHDASAALLIVRRDWQTVGFDLKGTEAESCCARLGMTKRP
jgi:hypothetical protein